jgi:hypothetical protein
MDTLVETIENFLLDSISTHKGIQEDQYKEGKRLYDLTENDESLSFMNGLIKAKIKRILQKIDK